MFRRRKKNDVQGGDTAPVDDAAADDGELLDADEAIEDAGDPSGPYDSADAPKDGLKRLDLGSMRVPVLAGVNVQMQGDKQGNVKQIVLVHEDSALQLTAVAAPRTEEIWDEVRDGIRAQIHREGGSVKDAEGEYGAELMAKLKGPKGQVQARFVGISGPRWLVRAVFQGKAAVDPDAAAVLDTCLRGLVIERGPEPKPVQEVLPLTLPAEVAEQAREQKTVPQKAANRKPSPTPRAS